MRIPIYQPNLTGNEKRYVNECLDTTWISSRGAFIGRFEEQFADYIGARYVTTSSSGTTALHLALAALGLGAGDEVIVPSLTYVASANMVAHVQAKPVFADSLADTWQVSPADIERKITKNTKAIMAVHLYGAPCDIAALQRICKKHNLYLIEDCAEAFGTLYDGQHVGTFGDMAIFSFFGNKTITTGEGGMVVARTRELLDKAYHLKTQAVSKTRTYWHDMLAYNYRMTNICAAIGLAQIERADSIVAQKRQIATWYDARLKNLPLTTHSEPENSRHSYWMYSIVLDTADERDGLCAFLAKGGIETRPFFYPVHTLPHYATGETLAVAEQLSAAGLNLPSGPDLSEAQIDEITQRIRTYLEDNKASIAS